MSQFSRTLLGLSVVALLLPLVSYAVNGRFTAWSGDSGPATESVGLAEGQRLEAAAESGAPSRSSDLVGTSADDPTISTEPGPSTSAADRSTTSDDQEHHDSTASQPSATTGNGGGGSDDGGHDDHGSSAPPPSAGATITGDACPCTVTGTSELKGTVNLNGDLMVDGGTLVARPGVTVNGNGFQIMFMNGGNADFQGSKTSTWSGNGSNANLTRDITFKSMRRVMFHSGAGKSTLRYFTIADSGNAGILGDYPLHFHLNGNSVRGTLVEGVVVVNGKNHAFVPHGSHGITFLDTIAKNIIGDAYWWDPPGTNNCGGLERECTTDNSNDILYDHALADGVKPSSSNQSHRNSGFMLGAGSGNVIRNSVARNIQGQSDCSGFHWPEQANQNVGGTVWGFRNNSSSSSGCHGIFVWQNDDRTHVIENFSGSGIDHGAYRNNYRYVSPNVPYFEVHALNWSGVTGGSIGQVIIRGHALPDPDPVVFSNTSIGSVTVVDGSGEHPGLFHFNGTGLTCGEVDKADPFPGTKVFVDGQEC